VQVWLSERAAEKAIGPWFHLLKSKRATIFMASKTYPYHEFDETNLKIFDSMDNIREIAD
jgi:hypothetical protein